jgi:hypothetical protein
VAQGLHRLYKLKHKQDDGLHHPVCVSIRSMFGEEYFSKMEIFAFLENHDWRINSGRILWADLPPFKIFPVPEIKS